MALQEVWWVCGSAFIPCEVLKGAAGGGGGAACKQGQKVGFLKHLADVLTRKSGGEDLIGSQSGFTTR